MERERHPYILHTLIRKFFVYSEFIISKGTKTVLQLEEKVAFVIKSVPFPKGTTFANQPSESPAKRGLSGANVKKLRSRHYFLRPPASTG
ncbi:hypothetical protein [Brevibacillus marinus]|uniref:hypothetical protein n=1 Tax=Brevibacillus marinus TaxID=2496837 RepID=UPI000F816619|nr:hypothetical protein [Brevibacillus marinus]